jgi:hypothetical protein
MAGGGVLAEVEAMVRDSRKVKCSVTVALMALDDERRAEVQALLDDKAGPPAAVIGRWLEQTTGVKVANLAAGRHRSGVCACR